MIENNIIKQDMKIDEYDLVEEWKNQPLKFEKYASLFVAYNYQKELKKDELEVVYSEIFKEIKGESEKKETEASIKAKIITDERYRKVKREYIDLCEKTMNAETIKWSFEHRKLSLEHICKLFMGKYYQTEDRMIQQQNEKSKLNRRLNND